MATYDADAASGRFLHRVSRHFCRPGSQLRTELAAFAGGGTMGQLLRQEVHVYLLATLDDTVEEAPHRDVSHISARAPASKVAWRAATFRLGQNLDAMDAHKATGGDAGQLLVRHKAVLQMNPQAYRCLRPARMPPATFLDRVYRANQMSLEDWGFLAGVVASSQAGEASGRPTPLVRLMVEYLRAVLRPGQFFSVPLGQPANANLQDTDTLATGEALEAGCRSAHFFQVYDIDVGRKKFIRTSFRQTVRAMAFPASLQTFEVWNGHTYPGQEQHVYPADAPAITDALRLASWPLLRAALRRWPVVEPSDVQGCTALRGSELVAGQHWDLEHPDTPAVVVLGALAKAGWRRQELGGHHVPGGPRVFDVEDYVAMKPYLQCLATLDRLWGRGLLLLPRGETPWYYRCVLLAAQPNSVPLGQPQAIYRNLAGHPADAGGQSGGDSPANDVHELASRANDAQGRESDEDQALASLALPLAQSSQPAGQPLRELGAHSGQQDSEIYGLPSRQPTTGTSSTSSSSSSEPSTPSSFSAPSEEPMASLANPRRDPQPRPAVDTVEGVAILEDVHGVPGQPGHYRRLFARCPVASHNQPGQPACGKRRGTGPAQVSRFGQAEPLAYLGVWLREAGQFPTQKAHVAFRPAPARVQEYMTAHGL